MFQLEPTETTTGIVGMFLTFKLYPRLLAHPFESVAVIVNEGFAAVVGVPEIIPVESIDKPAGKFPEVTAYL
jgi:hypothetical protein